MDPTAKRTIGQSGVEVTPLGLGGASYGSLFYEVPEADAHAAINAAWDAGVRYFDTAPWYGRGLSELRTGAGLRYKPRDEFVLSTKIGRWLKAQSPGSTRDLGPWKAPSPFDVVFDYSYDGIMRAYEQSQLRLGMTSYDMAVIHDLDPGYHVSQATFDGHLHQLASSGWRAIEELRTSGLIKAVGAGINYTGLIETFFDIVELDFFLVAMPYTLLDQPLLDREAAIIEERGMSIIIGSPFSSGLTAKEPGEDARYNYGEVPEEVIERVRGINTVSKRHGVPMGAVAIQFLFGLPTVASAIPGARSARHVEKTVEFFRTEIPTDLWAELKAEGLLREDAPTPS
jgi:D-threo-aldose 1-dehydrogenase